MLNLSKTICDVMFCACCAPVMQDCFQCMLNHFRAQRMQIMNDNNANLSTFRIGLIFRLVLLLTYYLYSNLPYHLSKMNQIRAYINYIALQKALLSESGNLKLTWRPKNAFFLNVFFRLIVKFAGKFCLLLSYSYLQCCIAVHVTRNFSRWWEFHLNNKTKRMVSNIKKYQSPLYTLNPALNIQSQHQLLL